MGIFLFLDGSPGVVIGIHEFGRETLEHGLLGARA
jgi:hypothetical protein